MRKNVLFARFEQLSQGARGRDNSEPDCKFRNTTNSRLMYILISKVPFAEDFCGWTVDKTESSVFKIYEKPVGNRVTGIHSAGAAVMLIILNGKIYLIFSKRVSIFGRKIILG